MDEFRILRRMADEGVEPSRESEARARAALDQAIAREKHSTMRRRRRQSLTTAAVATVIFFVALTIWPNPAPAWSTVPTSPVDPGLEATATADCPGHNGLPQSLPPLRAVDQRGSIALALFGQSQPSVTMHVCILVESRGVWAVSSVDDLDSPIATTAGYAGSAGEVDRVVVMNSEGETEVSYADGFYVMWWPRDVALAGQTMQFLDAAGQVLLSTTMRALGERP